jgi:hypothetical protein
MKWNKQVESERRFKFVGGKIRTRTKGKIKQFLSVEILSSNARSTVRSKKRRRNEKKKERKKEIVRKRRSHCKET